MIMSCTHIHRPVITQEDITESVYVYEVKSVIYAAEEGEEEEASSEDSGC